MYARCMVGLNQTQDLAKARIVAHYPFGYGSRPGHGLRSEPPARVMTKLTLRTNSTDGPAFTAVLNRFRAHVLKLMNRLSESVIANVVRTRGGASTRLKNRNTVLFSVNR